MKDRTNRSRLLFELEREHKLVKNLEMCFPNLLWQADVPNFEPVDMNLHFLFTAVNDGLFENKIKSTIVKSIQRPEPGLPAAAAFCGGVYKGQARQLIVFNETGQKTNFFHFICKLIHEMIHAYDYEHGPISEMLDNSGLIGQLNWGVYGSIGDLLKQARLQSSQLPDNMPNDRYPRQYAFPLIDIKNPEFNKIFKGGGDEVVRQFHEYNALIEKYNKLASQYQAAKIRGDQVGMYLFARDANKVVADITAFENNLNKLKCNKFRLSESSMYDVHGNFFMEWANKANAQGFDVSDIWDLSRFHRMRKVYEDRDEDPAEIHADVDPNPAKRMYDSLKSDDLIAYRYIDEENWFISIS